MVERPTAAAAVILLVSLAGCATGVPDDRPSGTDFGVKIVTERKEDVPCVEGLSLTPGDSCTHEGGRFWVEDEQACYAGRYLLFEQSDRQCVPSSTKNRIALGELCFDRQQDRKGQSKGCGSAEFGFGVERVAGTSIWQVSQVRPARLLEWDGRAIRVEGTCQVTPGTSSAGACLRLQISPPNGACIISDYRVRLVCNRTDATLLRSGKVHINGPTECPIFQTAESTMAGFASTRYSPVACNVHY